MATEDPNPTARFQEIQVERLVLREPGGGRVRAVLETVPATDEDGVAQVPGVRLTLLSPAGEPALVAEVGGDGTPTLFVGHPDRGVSIAISRQAVDLWSGGNTVASLRSTEEGGTLEISDGDGRQVVELPEPPSA